PDGFAGVNLRSPSGEQPKGDGKSGRKASGLLMVDGILYMWARNAGNAQLAWSRDHARTWTWADWKFTTSFDCPCFLNLARHSAAPRRASVSFSPHAPAPASQPAARLVLARVPKGRIRDRAAYEFFQALDPDGRPSWTRNLDDRGAVFTNPGRCYRIQ